MTNTHTVAEAAACTPENIDPPAPRDAAQARRAFLIAARAVVADIQTEGIRLPGAYGRDNWWDITPMVDDREQPAESVDMARQAIDYALAVGIAQQHPTQPRWLRIVWRGR